MNKKQLLRFAAASCLLGAVGAKAENITVEDPNTGSNHALYYENTPATGGNYAGKSYWTTGEYQEVEPGMQGGPFWDLVAFSHDNTTSKLSILTGFDFINPRDGMEIGHLFIDLDGDANLHPDPNSPYNVSEPNSFYKYDLGIIFDIANGRYYVYELTDTTTMFNGIYAPSTDANSASNPWKFDPSTAIRRTDLDGGLVYNVDISTTAFNALSTGGAMSHTKAAGDTWLYDSLTMDPLKLAEFYPNGEGAAYFHLTMKCGNDNLAGRRSGSWNRVPDGGATLTLLGLSMAGISMFRRKLKA